MTTITKARDATVEVETATVEDLGPRAGAVTSPAHPIDVGRGAGTAKETVAEPGGTTLVREQKIAGPVLLTLARAAEVTMHAHVVRIPQKVQL